MSDAEVVTLREHIERLMEEHEKADQERHRAEQTALEIAKEIIEARFESVNYIRGTLNDQAGRFLTIATFDAKHDPLEKRVGAMERMSANLEGRLWAIGAGMTILNVALNLAAFMLRK